MSDPAHGELLLACLDCRRVVAVAYHPPAVAQGQTDLDEHRACGCGKTMVETERCEDCSRVLLPKEACSCRS